MLARWARRWEWGWRRREVVRQVRRKMLPTLITSMQVTESQVNRPTPARLLSEPLEFI
jgi:hypothetical protein